MHHPIDRLMVQKNQVLVSSENGNLYVCKSMDGVEGAMVGPGFKIEAGSTLAVVKDNTVINVSKDGNILCL